MYRLSKCVYLESIFYVGKEFSFVIKQVDGVLVPKNGPVPQTENNDNVFRLGKFEEGAHIANHSASTIRPSDVTTGVVGWSVITLYMKPQP